MSGRPVPATLRLLSAVVATAVAAAGCSASNSGPDDARSPAGPATASATPWSKITPLADPRTYVGATTAHVANADIEPITTRPQPHLPATVTDSQGTRVTVRSDARILALDLYGTLSATVYGLGLGTRLVGRDVSTGFPAARDLPLVTSKGHRLNAEAILALHPSVLITDTTLGPWDAVLQVRDAGVPVVVMDPKRTLDTVTTLINQVAHALGVVAEGTALATRTSNQIVAERRQIAAVAPRDAARRPRIMFLYARGQAGVYYLFGQGSGADSLIDALRGVDVATEGGIRGFVPLNSEALAKAKPDVIMMMTGGLESVGGLAGALKLPGVGQTPAGRHRRIVDASDYEVLSFGPLTAQVLDALARALYAPTSIRAPR